MNWKLFLQALAVSAVAGCANAASQSLAASMATGGKTSWKSVGNTAILGATLGALTFAAQNQPQQAAPTPQLDPAKQ